MALLESSLVKTGVPGLDELLNGGLPGPHFYLVEGGPGVGKTTFALQFLREGLSNGESVLYVSLSQTKRELLGIAKSHGWSLDGMEVVELAYELDTVAEDQTIFQTADLRLDKTRNIVVDTIARLKPTRVVYDSLLEIRHLSENPERFRREILSFKQSLEEQNVAALLIDVTPEHGGDAELESLAHGIIRLDKYLPTYGPARRRLEIKKMRGVPHPSGLHDMKIASKEGVVTFPRVGPSHEREDESTSNLIKSGVNALDDMLGGGMEAGTTTLVIGQPGTGKSTISSLYAEAALSRGEAVSLFLFEERKETFFRRSEGLGIELRKHRDAGNFQLFDFDPAEVSPGEFANAVAKSVEEAGSRVVVIDSFTGYVNSLPRSEEAVMQMHSLLKFLARQGVLTILIVAQHGLLGDDPGTDVDVSFLGDTVLLLRMVERPTHIERTVAVIKKRHGPHDLDIQELHIKSDGVTIEPFNAPPVERA